MKSFTGPLDNVPETWRERLATLRYVPPLLAMVWETSPIMTACAVFLRVSNAFIPISILWISRSIVNLVVRAITHQQYQHRLIWKLLAIEIALGLASTVLSRLITLLDSLLGDRFTNHVSLKLLSHATSLDLASFEDPDLCDKMERARRQASARLGTLTSLAAMFRQTLTLLSMISVIFLFSPWLLCLLVAGTVPLFLSETKLALLNYSILFRQTPQRRELDYVRYLGTSSYGAKEVKIFGLGNYLSQRLSTLFETFYAENKRMAIRRATEGGLISLAATLSYYGAYAYILTRAISGSLTVGDLAMIAGAFSRANDLTENLVNGMVDVSEQALYIRDLFDYFQTKPSIVSKANAALIPRPIRLGYEFENVSFVYPKSERQVLSNVSFHLRPSEQLALVGENGAGKTTIVKLMARLYDPTEGRILLDGVDLREYSIDDLRRTIGVIFQDYLRYDMLAGENIGLGRIEELGNIQRIKAAAHKSHAASLIDNFPNQYEQMLGRRFEGGVDLSGGQWQKIALARAYMRDAEILILDEPTANLDARAEAEVYQQFVDLSGRKMTVLISHRFSTVRMADRIVVLEQGRIVEEGSHRELLALGRRYAELFDLQAAGYR
jgi:ATP-binding cassette subfamily B protein